MVTQTASIPRLHRAELDKKFDHPGIAPSATLN
jgi:hypothetical protein